MKAVIYTRDDDECMAAEKLLCSEIPDIMVFRSPDDGHGHYSVRYDIAIISVEGAEGMEIMLELNSRSPDTQIIWITSDKHFAGMAIRNHICGFLVKPYTEEQLRTAVRDAAEKCSATTTWRFGRRKKSADK